MIALSTLAVSEKNYSRLYMVTRDSGGIQPVLWNRQAKFCEISEPVSTTGYCE